MAKEITVFYGDVMIKGSTKGVTDLLQKLAAIPVSTKPKFEEKCWKNAPDYPYRFLEGC